MELAIALGLIQTLPGILAAIQSIRASLSTDDQATLDAAIAANEALANIDITKAAADLNAAAKA